MYYANQSETNFRFGQPYQANMYGQVYSLNGFNPMQGIGNGIQGNRYYFNGTAISLQSQL
jgi:hypothetical protein